MRWVALGAGVLVGLVVLVVAVGALLPRSHVAPRTVHLASPPEAVWRTLTTVAAYPEWRPGVKSVEPLPADGDRLAWRELGAHDAVAYEITEMAPPTRLVTRITTTGLPYGGSWLYELAPAPDGTTLTITERGEVYNPLFRFVSRVVMGHHATIDAYLAALSKRLGGMPPSA